MEDHIRKLINTLQTCHLQLVQLYANPQGVHFGPEDERPVTRLLRAKAARTAHDGSIRLDSTLRKFFDRSTNRRGVFGQSTHYQVILDNLETAVEAYLESLPFANHTLIQEKLNNVFEQCDDFAAGMTMDIEDFRAFIQTNSGFSGNTLEEKIRYNENRLKRALELVRNVDMARSQDFMERTQHADDLRHVLEKEFFSRLDGIQQRLREVAQDLSQNLFELQLANAAAIRLINLDNYLSKDPELVLPAWETMEEPPQWAMVFHGIHVVAYPDPNSVGYIDALGTIIAHIKDDLPPLPKVKRGNEVLDLGEPAARILAESQFFTAFFQFIEHVLANGQGGAMEWLENNRSAFAFGDEVWLQMISNDMANDTLKVPGQVRAQPLRCEINDEYCLTDVLFTVDKKAAHV